MAWAALLCSTLLLLGAGGIAADPAAGASASQGGNARHREPQKGSWFGSRLFKGNGHKGEHHLPSLTLDSNNLGAGEADTADVQGGEEVLINLAPPAAVHMPLHVTVLPEEVQSAMAGIATGAHPASVAGEHLVDGVHISHDDRLGGPDGSQGAKDGKQEAADKAEGGQQPAAAAKPRPEGATAATARRVLQELQLSVSGAAHAIKQASQEAQDKLSAREAETHKLHTRALEVTQFLMHDAQKAQAELDRLEAAVVEARSDSHFLKAEQLEKELVAQRDVVAAAQGAALSAMRDAAALAHTHAIILAAKAHEKHEQERALSELASLAESGAERLSQEAGDVRGAARAAGQEAKQLLKTAATAVDEAKVRQQVGQIADEALQALDNLDERMAEARTAYQERWRADLGASHRVILAAALTREAEEQLRDLTWRRDMAIQGDAYPEAAAAQAAVERLESVIAASSPPLHVGLAPDGAPVHHKPANGAEQAAASAAEAGTGGMATPHVAPTLLTESEASTAAENRAAMLAALQEYTRLHDKQSCLQGLLSSLGKLAQALASQVVPPKDALRRAQAAQETLHKCVGVQQ